MTRYTKSAEDRKVDAYKEKLAAVASKHTKSAEDRKVDAYKEKLKDLTTSS
jgi:hypothetical protein